MTEEITDPYKQSLETIWENDEVRYAQNIENCRDFYDALEVEVKRQAALKMRKEPVTDSKFQEILKEHAVHLPFLNDPKRQESFNAMIAEIEGADIRLAKDEDAALEVLQEGVSQIDGFMDYQSVMNVDYVRLHDVFLDIGRTVDADGLMQDRKAFGGQPKDLTKRVDEWKIHVAENILKKNDHMWREEGDKEPINLTYEKLQEIKEKMDAYDQAQGNEFSSFEKLNLDIMKPEYFEYNIDHIKAVFHDIDQRNGTNLLEASGLKDVTIEQLQDNPALAFEKRNGLFDLHHSIHGVESEKEHRMMMSPDTKWLYALAEHAKTDPDAEKLYKDLMKHGAKRADNGMGEGVKGLGSMILLFGGVAKMFGSATSQNQEEGVALGAGMTAAGIFGLVKTIRGSRRIQEKDLENKREQLELLLQDSNMQVFSHPMMESVQYMDRAIKKYKDQIGYEENSSDNKGFLEGVFNKKNEDNLGGPEKPDVIIHSPNNSR